MFKSILEKAIIISNELNDDVKIEHLFQAIIDEGEGIAIRILMNLNINLDIDLRNPAQFFSICSSVNIGRPF